MGLAVVEDGGFGFGGSSSDFWTIVSLSGSAAFALGMDMEEVEMGALVWKWRGRGERGQKEWKERVAEKKAMRE